MVDGENTIVDGVCYTIALMSFPQWALWGMGLSMLATVGGIVFLLRGKQLSNRVKWDRLIGSLIIGLLLSPACICISYIIVSNAIDRVTPRPLHPTYESLENRGFYVFVLPEEEINLRGWGQEITLWSWNSHCGVLIGDTYNPLMVTYRDEVGGRVFEIQHGPWRMIWNGSETITTTQVALESEWSSTSSLTHKTRLGQNNMIRHRYYFVDRQGWGVDIASSLSVTETLELIEMLEYVGPPVEKLNDPWDCKN